MNKKAAERVRRAERLMPAARSETACGIGETNEGHRIRDQTRERSVSLHSARRSHEGSRSGFRSALHWDSWTSSPPGAAVRNMMEGDAGGAPSSHLTYLSV